MRRLPFALTLFAVRVISPALRALLPLALFAFWLLPSVSPVHAAPAVSAARATTVSVGVVTQPLTLHTRTLSAPLDPPDHRAPIALIPPARTVLRLLPPALGQDLTTRSRSRAPIYRVRRSGQAHRSAP